MMVIYDIFFRDINIGVLEIDEENNKHRYTPNSENLLKMEKNFNLFEVLKNEADWRRPIPFFQNRIDNFKRAGQNLNIINYQTDDYIFKLREC